MAKASRKPSRERRYRRIQSAIEPRNDDREKTGDTPAGRLNLSVAAHTARAHAPYGRSTMNDSEMPDCPQSGFVAWIDSNPPAVPKLIGD
jgi:hypothetical protein